MRPALALALVLALPAPVLAGGDFNGDGFDDAALAAPLDPVLVGSTGSVSVVYGSSFGFPVSSVSDDEQIFTAFHFGLVPNFLDDFGRALAIGDFDGDGLGDLAVGIPLREVAGFANAGAVGIVYGAPFGLDPDRWQLFSQATKGIKDAPELVTGNFGDEFGSALAAGDFDGDGRDDLAVGARGEAVGAAANAGAVHVLRGSKKGLRAKKNQLFTREALLGPGAPSTFFGAELATGDFDADGRDDLAIGAVLTEIGGQSAGAADVLYGSPKGLTASRHVPLDPISLLGVRPRSTTSATPSAPGISTRTARTTSRSGRAGRRSAVSSPPARPTSSTERRGAASISPASRPGTSSRSPPRSSAPSTSSGARSPRATSITTGATISRSA